MKKLLLAAVAGLVFSGAALADNPVIRCDPNATGSTQYPNVSCTSNGYINVNATVSGSGPTTGAAANGAAVSGNPVLVAGYDGTNARTVLTDTSGRQVVNINGTVPVSGSVTVSGTVTTSGTVTPSPTAGALTNKSGTITTGGTSQTLSAATTRHYFFVQNLSSGNLYINFTSAASAAAGSILLLPNTSYVQEGSFVTNEQINIFGGTTGQAFTAKEN